MKKIFFLCIGILSIGLCAFQTNASEREPESSKTGQTAGPGDEWTEAYQNLLLEEDVKRMALIFLDDDDIPELLTLQDGEYRLYTFDGLQVTAVDMPDTGIRACAYSFRHKIEEFPWNLTFVWFEYVPYRGLIRVHDSGGGGRRDYYLKYEKGSLTSELEAEFIDSRWRTYSQQEISNEKFLSMLPDLGYDRLIPCGYLYGNLEDAFENMGRTSDSREVLDDFVGGEIDALYYVKEKTDIPEDGFVMISYEDICGDILTGDDDGSTEYVDFDNDGEEELVIRSDTGACAFFDVIGSTVYKVMGVSEDTAGITYVAEMEGKRVIASLDESYRAKKRHRCYFIRQYDSCGCLVDYFRLFLFYEGADYSAADEFTYREQPVTVEKFEEIERSIKQILPESEGDKKEDIEMGKIKTVLSLDEMFSIIALDENGHVWKWKEWQTKADAALIAELENVVQITDTGGASVYALTEEGDVYGWGINWGLMIDPEAEENTRAVFPKPVKHRNLSNITKLETTNGRGFAVDREGRLFVWGLGRYKYRTPDYIPSLVDGFEERTDNVEEIYAGAGDFHYFKRKDDQIFSFMLSEHLTDELSYFIAPEFEGEPSVSNWYNDIRSGECDRIFDVRIDGGPCVVYLYEMGKKDDIALISADGYTMYLYQKDGTLWYWNSDIITYHDKERAGASVESRDLDYSGFFEKADICNVLQTGTDSAAVPKIISISPGIEGALFLLENGEVLASEYVTTQIRDVEYFARSHGNPQNTWTEVAYDLPLKGLSFRKLDFENIINISSDKDNKFYLVDKDGNIYCHQIKAFYTETGFRKYFRYEVG